MSILKFILVLLAVVLVTTAAAVNPGTKIRITKKAIDYVSTIAQKTIHNELKNLRISDQSGSRWSISNIQNRGIDLPTSRISLNPGKNGLDWAISNLGIRLRADWRIKYRKGWFKISTSGSVSLGARGASVRSSIALGKDSTDRPTIRAAGCSASIAGVDVKFHGGIGWLLNMFSGTIERRLKDKLVGEICKIVNKAINTNGNNQLKKIKVTAGLGRKFLLDYRLTATPRVSSQYLQSEHKGAIYWAQNRREPPFSPSPIPPSTDGSKMFYIWLTEFTANSYAYAAQTNGVLSRNFSSINLPVEKRGLLSTTCSNLCVGKIIPQIGKAYPNSEIHMKIASTSSPTMNINKGSAALTAQGNIDMFATTPNKTEVHLMTLNTTLFLNLTAKIEHERLTGEIASYHLSLDVVKSDIGNIVPNAMTMILKAALDIYGIPMLNEFCKKGIDLPVSGDVTFVNPSLHFLDNSLLIATDLTYAYP